MSSVTGWRSPGTVSEDTSVGNRVFTNPANVASAAGGAVTTISWATGICTSSRLKCSNWGFTSADFTGSVSSIDGIEFRYTAGETGIADNLETMEIYYIDSSGVLQTGTNKADTGEWATTPGVRTVGGAADKMGYTGAVYADIIDTDFGISFRVQTVGGSSGTTPDGTLDNFEMRIYYTASTGRTTSMASTEEEDTMSAAVQVKNNSAMARTEEEDTMSATAKVQVTASMAKTEEEDAMSAAAKVKLTASMARTEEEDTMAATASSTIHTSMAKTEEEDTMSATAKVAVKASMARTEEEDTMAANATVGGTAHASMAATEEEDTMAATAKVKLTASMARTEEEDTMAATAKVKLTASMAATEDDDTMAANATRGRVVSMAATEDEDTMAATATVSGGTPTPTPTSTPTPAPFVGVFPWMRKRQSATAKEIDWIKIENDRREAFARIVRAGAGEETEADKALRLSKENAGNASQERIVANANMVDQFRQHRINAALLILRAA